MELDSSIFVAGHRGLVGSALVRRLKLQGYKKILTVPHSDVDLTDAAETSAYFSKVHPDYVFLAAAKVGGIIANRNYPAEFISDNVKIATNVVNAAYLNGVKKLIYFGSSCVYPKFAPQPITEDALLSGPLEPTNEAYAIAKIAGIMLCRAFNKEYKTNYVAVMPTNLYGPNDNYNLETSHVLPAMIRKFHEAKIEKRPSVTLWGTGTPKREFLYSDDLADACIMIMNYYDIEFHNLYTIGDGIVNIGSGDEYTISGLAEIIKDAIGFEGEILYDQTKPDGPPRKLVDSSIMNSLCWRPRTSLEKGIQLAYDDFIKNQYSKTAFVEVFRQPQNPEGVIGSPETDERIVQNVDSE
jgi:GDP-L-fucose synthase